MRLQTKYFAPLVVVSLRFPLFFNSFPKLLEKLGEPNRAKLGKHKKA
jgi:hypothetical protein